MLSCGQADPHLLLCACNDNLTRIFDLRASKTPSIVLQPHQFKTQLAGLVFEPNGRSGIIVSGEGGGGGLQWC